MSETTAGGMRLRFWGVRGSTPCPGPATVHYGGNTPCLELRCGPHLLVLDAGTGARLLGEALVRAAAPRQADVLLSHTHLDHIGGLPFFAPMYTPGWELRFWAGHLGNQGGLRAALERSWSAPLMPDLGEHFRARLSFNDFAAGSTLELHPGLKVTTAALNHPGGATGYRVEWAGRAMAYVTDTEHAPGELDPVVMSLVRGVDLLVYDSSYTDAELPRHRGWGHSTWEHAVRLASAAGVGRLALFHHEPGRDDDAMAAIEAAAAALRPGTLAAREGLELAL